MKTEKPNKKDYVYSMPTICLHCYLIVQMFHPRDADSEKGAWQCSKCGATYPFHHWKIKKAREGGKSYGK